MPIPVFMDVDGVLRDLIAVCRRYFPKDRITEYDNRLFGIFWRTLAADEELAKELYLTAPVVPGALKGLRWIRENINPSIHFLTASDIKKWPWLRQYTEKWLVTSGCFEKGDEVIFVSGGDEKTAIINKRKSIVFDDRVDTINTVKKPSSGVWVESGLTLDSRRLRTTPNLHRIKRLSDMTKDCPK